MKLKAKKPLPHLTVKAAKSTSSDSLQAKVDTGEGQLKLTIPDPAGPMFGSAFQELARDCKLPKGPQGALMLRQLRFLEEGVNLLRQRYRHEMGQDPDCVPGWGLQITQVREIPNTLAALELVADMPALRDMFLEACKVSLTKLEKGCPGQFDCIFGEAIANPGNRPPG